MKGYPDLLNLIKIKNHHVVIDFGKCSLSTIPYDLTSIIYFCEFDILDF